jgi:hypothetical protein
VGFGGERSLTARVSFGCRRSGRARSIPRSVKRTRFARVTLPACSANGAGFELNETHDRSSVDRADRPTGTRARSPRSLGVESRRLPHSTLAHVASVTGARNAMTQAESTRIWTEFRRYISGRGVTASYSTLLQKPVSSENLSVVTVLGPLADGYSRNAATAANQ